MTEIVKCIRDSRGRIVPRWSLVQRNRYCSTRLRQLRRTGQVGMLDYAGLLKEGQRMLRSPKFWFDCYTFMLDGQLWDRIQQERSTGPLKPHARGSYCVWNKTARTLRFHIFALNESDAVFLKLALG